MEKPDFLNRIRSLFNIDGYLLPELSSEQQGEFLRDPVRYFMNADKAHGDAIWREVEKRQVEKHDPLIAAAPDLLEALDDMLSEFDADEFGSEGQMQTCSKARTAIARATGAA